MRAQRPRQAPCGRGDDEGFPSSFCVPERPDLEQLVLDNEVFENEPNDTNENDNEANSENAGGQLEIGQHVDDQPADAAESCRSRT